MNLFDLFGNLFFVSFQDLVDWLAGLGPLIILSVFLINCLFSILTEIIHFGGKK